MAAQPAVSLSNTHPREALYVLVARVSLRAGLARNLPDISSVLLRPSSRQDRLAGSTRPNLLRGQAASSCLALLRKPQALLLALRKHLSRAGTWPAGTAKRGQVGVSSSNDEDPDKLDAPSGKQVTLPRRTPSHDGEPRLEHHDAPRSDQRKDRRRRAPSAS